MADTTFSSRKRSLRCVRGRNRRDDFAMNGKWDSELVVRDRDFRAPYSKAVAIFPKGDCWHGGGLWTSKSKYWLNDGHGHTVLRDSTAVNRDEFIRSDTTAVNAPECIPSAVADGWTLVETLKIGKMKDVTIFTKAIGQGWTLCELRTWEVDAPLGKGCYTDEHELVPPGADPGLGRTGNGPTWTASDSFGRPKVSSMPRG